MAIVVDTAQARRFGPGRARVRGLTGIVAADSHPFIVPRVRTYLECEIGADEAARKAWILHWQGEGLRTIEAHLGDGAAGRYCHGDAVTIADVCLASLASGYAIFGGRLADFPRCASVVDRCMALDAFAQAHPLAQPGAPAAA